jgi:nucleoside-diphosphate-sugar epimerase
MRVFVAGATGAIGRPLVPKLVEAGHEVSAMTRSPKRAAALRKAGARPAVADVFDEPQVQEAVAAASPEVIVHQLTALPSEGLDFRDPELYTETNRLRTEGTRILMDAGRASGARRFIAQSIAFAYAQEGDWVKDEDAPLVHDAAGHFAEVAGSLAELDQAVTGADDMEGLVLRYGFFYGPGTYYAPGGATARDVRRRRFPVVGKGDGVFSFVHVDDAADATVAAIKRGAPGVYNVVDDEPAPLRDWLPVFAEAIGARPPRRVPRWLARLSAGKEAVQFATSLRGASNAKAKRELGWRPRHPSWRQGFSEALS